MEILVTYKELSDKVRIIEASCFVLGGEIDNRRGAISTDIPGNRASSILKELAQIKHAVDGLMNDIR